MCRVVAYLLEVDALSGKPTLGGGRLDALSQAHG
jgi:hypothetical protein